MSKNKPQKPHIRLLNDLRRRIKWDIRVSHADVDIVSTETGEIIVRGQVDSPFRKQALMDIVESTYGVRKLVDQVQIKPEFKRSDDALRLILTTTLLELKFGVGEWIDVDVKNSVVHFSGVVFRPRLKAAAAKAAWELSGVLDCQNEILVKPDPRSQPRVQSATSFRRLVAWPTAVAATATQRGYS